MDLIRLFLTMLKSKLDDTAEDCTFPENVTISVGSTPSARHHRSLQPSINGANVEIHPGNYTLYDRQQLWSGSCSDEKSLAGRVISRVIGHYEDRGAIMLDAGALALTKDTTPQGGVCAIAGQPDLVCYRMSQEVIMVKTNDPGTTFPFDRFPLGTIVSLLPNHSCLAAACFERYYVIDDQSSSFSPNQEIVDEWIPAKYFDLP
jgi:D-serine ammonia-lyase